MAGYKHLEIPGNFERYVKDKKQSANAYYRYFLARLCRMFEYKNLPDTIPHATLDRYLMNNGIACITEVEGKLYCFYGNMGGPQDVYYRPTEFIISNPHVKSNGELFTANIPVFQHYQPTEEVPGAKLGQPRGVLIRNDTEWIGLAPLLSRYSYLMAENILTLRTADVMLRIVAMITAPSDKEKAAATEYLKAIENGNLSAVGESAFFDGIKLQSPPSNNGSYLTQFIEYQQYLKGSLYNEMGLSANYNMKREAIGKGESTLDEDALFPLVDDMLLARREDLALVNDMYNTNIEVSFSSSWLKNELESLSAIASFSSSGSAQSFGQPGSTPTDQPGESEGESGTGSVEPTGGNGATGADKEEDTNEKEETKELSGADKEEDTNEKEETKELSGSTPDDGQEETNVSDSDATEVQREESDDETDGKSSENNDISWSDTLQKAKDNLEEKIEKGDEVNELPLDAEGAEKDRGDNSSDERDIQSHELQLSGGSEQNDT